MNETPKSTAKLADRLLLLLSSQHISELVAVLSSPEASQQLAGFLRNNNVRYEAHALVHGDPLKIHFTREDEFLDQRRAFQILLGDRESLPATKDVINLINSALGFSYRVSDYKRKGREAVISRCWDRLSRLSANDRAKGMGKIIDALPAVRENKEYQRMFKILARDEATI